MLFKIYTFYVCCYDVSPMNTELSPLYLYTVHCTYRLCSYMYDWCCYPFREIESAVRREKTLLSTPASTF
jgi:hypothetical protein